MKTIILAGASNLGSLKPVFQTHGATVIDLTKPGWMITDKNLESLRHELSALSHMEDTAVIFDIFGNSAYKFRHVDGTLVLPFRVGGGYHFLGDISMDSDGKIGELISQAKPVFCAVKDLLCLIMPPNPRYVYSGCCTDGSHSTNLGSDGYPAQILEAALHFRKILKTALVGSEELGRFWVTDTLACLNSIPATTREKLEALRLAIGPDGVHFTDFGRFHVFNSLAKTIIGLQDGTGQTAKTSRGGGFRFCYRSTIFLERFQLRQGIHELALPPWRCLRRQRPRGCTWTGWRCHTRRSRQGRSVPPRSVQQGGGRCAWPRQGRSWPRLASRRGRD